MGRIVLEDDVYCLDGVPLDNEATVTRWDDVGCVQLIFRWSGSSSDKPTFHTRAVHPVAEPRDSAPIELDLETASFTRPGQPRPFKTTI
jgi:hypothetical protein